MTPQTQQAPSWKEIGKHLQRLRKDAGYSSAAMFAEKIGFNVGTYTSYEQGNSRFNYQQAWIMADALGCSMDDLGGRKAPRKYIDQRQAELNEVYSYLDEANKSAAVGAVRGIAANQAREKTGGDGLPVDSKRTA